MTFKEQFEELTIAWRASRAGDTIRAADFEQFLSGLVMLLVTDSVRTMLRTGMTTDEVNQYLESTLMPDMRRMQHDAIGTFNAVLNDPHAPSHGIN